MTIDDLSRVLVRDLRTLAAELDAYPDDASVWACPPGIHNSAGTLVLHLAGNLRHFVGARLGGTGYVRDRAAEFAARGLSRAELRALVDAAAVEVGAALAGVDPRRLDESSRSDRERGCSVGRFRRTSCRTPASPRPDRLPPPHGDRDARGRRRAVAALAD
jgi:hypothetical protein